MKIGELKQMCQKPEVVEVWDVTAADPRTLVFLKVREPLNKLLAIFSSSPTGTQYPSLGTGLRRESICKEREG